MRRSGVLRKSYEIKKEAEHALRRSQMLREAISHPMPMPMPPPPPVYYDPAREAQRQSENLVQSYNYQKAVG